MAIKYDVNQTKTKWQYQRIDTKKDPLKSASTSLALNLVTLNVSNEQVNDDIHCIKIPKRKTNGDLLSKKKILEEYGDVFDTLECLPGELHLEVHKSIQLSTAHGMEDTSCNEGGNNEENCQINWAEVAANEWIKMNQ